MAVLVYSEIANLAKDRAQINVTTDAPMDATVLDRFINEAYADVYAASGGRIKTVASATAWTNAELSAGRLFGILTDVEDVQHLWYTTTAPAAISCTTNATTSLTSSAAFGNVVPGMAISGTGIPANTFVLSVTSASALTMTIAATDSSTTSRTFSPTTGTEVERAELSEILALRSSSSGFPTYLVPKRFSIARRATTTAASVNLLQVDYWPSVTGFYFPMDYTPQFTPIDSATVTTPDVNDLESRDIPLLAASRICQVFGRHDLVPGILADLSQRTTLALERKLRAMLDSKQDA